MRKNKKHITREDLQRYLRGELSNEQMHEFERLSSEDSFLSDAMEGYEDVIPNNLDRDLDNLDFRMEESHLKDAPEIVDTSFPFMKVAATVTLLAVATVIGYFLYQGIPEDLFKGDRITMSEESNEEPAPESTQPEIIEEETFDEETPKTRKEVTPPPEIPDNQVTESDADSKIQAATDEMDAGAGVNLQDELATTSSDSSDGDLGMVALVSEVADETIMDDSEETETIDPAILVEGQVVSASGNQPIPNADVGIMNTNQRTRTNEMGEFSMEKSGSEDVVIAYADGYSSESARTTDNENLTIRLNSSVPPSANEIAQPAAAIREDSESRQKKAMEAPAEIEASIPPRPKPVPEVTMDQYKQYLSDNLIYPAQAEQNSVEGNVILNVGIDATGSISDINILLGIGSGCNEEAVRLVREGPGWLPAVIDGEPADSNVQVVVPFQFD